MVCDHCPRHPGRGTRQVVIFERQVVRRSDDHGRGSIIKRLIRGGKQQACPRRFGEWHTDRVATARLHKLGKIGQVATGAAECLSSCSTGPTELNQGAPQWIKSGPRVTAVSTEN